MTVFLFVISELEFALEEKQRVLSSRPNYKEEYHALKTQVGTIQTFHTCTRQLEICQCLVVKTPMDNMLKR